MYILILINSYYYTPPPLRYMHSGGSGPGVLLVRVHPARRGGAEGGGGAGRGVLELYGGD